MTFSTSSGQRRAPRCNTPTSDREGLHSRAALCVTSQRCGAAFCRRSRSPAERDVRLFQEVAAPVIRRAAACAALFFAVSGGACAATLAQLDAWLASSPKIVREKPPASAANRSRYISVKGVDESTGWVDPSLVTDRFLADGQRVMIVPIDSGGSGGVFTALLFTRIGGMTRFVGT